MNLPIKKLVSTMHRAVAEFSLISPNDKIAVGISGGKDSLTLLACLAQYKKQVPYTFEIIAIAIDIFSNTNYEKIEKFCKELNVKFIVKKSNIKEIVFDIRKEKNPCSLCANLRRGLLNSEAKKQGCNKVALGHHADDFIQTFFMSIAKENRLSSLQAISYLSKTNLYVIRPLIYVFENQIETLENKLPIIKNNCPANKKTEREHTKKVIAYLEQEYPNFKKNILGAITKTERYNLLDKSKIKIKKNNKIKNFFNKLLKK